MRIAFRILVVLSLFFFHVQVKANEELDSLVAELYALEDENNVESLGVKALLCSDIADLYLKLYSDQDYSRTYLLQGVSFVKKKITMENKDTEDLVLLTDFYRRLGLFELSRGNVEASNQYMSECEKCLKRFSSTTSLQVSNKAWYEFYHSYFGLSFMVGNYPAGEKYLNLAYDIVETDTNLAEFKVNILSELSALYSMLGNNDGAISYSAEALRIFEEKPLDDQPLDRFIFFHLRALSFANDFDRMDSVLNSYPHYKSEESLNAYLDKNEGIVTRAMFESIFLMGDVKRKSFLANGDSLQIIESYEWLRKGFYVAQKLTLRNDGEKIGNVLLHPERKMAGLLATYAILNENSLVENNTVVELIEIIDFYQSSRLHLERVSYQVNAESWAKEKELKNEIQFLNIKIEELDSTVSSNNNILDSLTTIQNKLSKELIEVKRKTKREKVLDNYRISQAEFAESFQSYLNRTDKTLLTYFYAEKDSALYIFGANSEETLFEKVAVEKDFVSKIEQAYHYNAHIQLENESIEDQRKKNKLLYTYLFQPVESFIKTPQVLIYPFNEVSYVSFDALLNEDDKYLVHDYQFQYTSSLFSVISEDYEKIKEAGSFLSFYPSDYGTDSLAFLLNAQHEVDAIEEMMESVTYKGADASKEMFLKNVNENKVIHLASHSHLDVTKPYESYIIFDHSGDTLDNRLFAYEIFSLTMDAEMITLSSCNSAKGELEDGIGVVSLSNAFYFAGIPSTVSSLWSAQDKSSSEIMIAFYENLNAGESKSVSLQKAKIDYLKSADKIKAQPFFWANYALYGSDDPIYEKPTGFWKWGLGLALLMLIGVFFYFRSSKRA